jgi:phage protein D
MSKLTVTGEDVSVMMDLEERSVEHPAQPDLAIVAGLIARYAKYGMVPVVIPPKVIDPPLPIERIPVQRGTDLAYVEELAKRNGHVFYVTAGPLPFTNTAYWGPPKRVSVPQKALTVNAGSSTNVDSISFQQDAMAPELVTGKVEDRRTNRKLPVRTFASLRVPLSTRPNWLVNRANTRQVLFDEPAASFVSAFGRAQAQTDLSTDRTVTASGALDAARYGDILTARGLVGLRGAGYSYDGLYYVKQVSHSIKHGAYTQSFILTRDGLGSTVPVVRP